MQLWQQELFSTKQYGKDGLPATIHLADPVLQLHKGRRGAAAFTGIRYCTCMYHPTDLAYPASCYRSPLLILAEYFHGFLHSNIFAACNTIDSSLRSNHL